MIQYKKEILMNQENMKREEEEKIREVLKQLDRRFQTLFADASSVFDITIALIADPKYLRYQGTIVNLLKLNDICEKTIIFHLVAYFNLASFAKKKILEKTFLLLPYFHSFKEENGIYEWETVEGVLRFKTFDSQLAKKAHILELKEHMIDAELRNVKVYVRDINDAEECLINQKKLLKDERESLAIQRESYSLLHQFRKMPFDAVDHYHSFYPNSYVTVFEKPRFNNSPEFYSCLTTKNNKTVYDIPSNTIYVDNCFVNVFGGNEIYKVPSGQYAKALMEYQEKYPTNKIWKLNALNLALAPENIAKIDSQNFCQETEKGLTK